MHRPPKSRAASASAVSALCVVMATAASCQGDPKEPPTDQPRRLEILTPPGDSIGLTFGGNTTLPVRYLSSEGTPVDGAAVEFELVAGPGEDVGASTLSASIAATTAAGRAEITVVAGHTPANFRIRVSAPRAIDMFFFVVVSDSGFAEINISPSHQGPRPTSDYNLIEVRLYDPSQIRCIDLDIDDLPTTILPTRQTNAFDTTVQIPNLAANRDYVIIAWGEPEPLPTRMGVGCIEITADQLDQTPSVTIVLGVLDRPLRWPVSPVDVQSVVVLAELRGALDAIVAPDPWQAMGCPLGPAQLILDCLLDAAAPDGDLDCNVEGTSALLTAIATKRGTTDNAGCHGTQTSEGETSLEQTLTTHLTRGPWTAAAASELAIRQRQLLSGFTLTSSLAFSAPVATHHRLKQLHLIAAGIDSITELDQSTRAVIEAITTATVIHGDLNLAPHGFTFDFEKALSSAFVKVHLPSQNLGGRVGDLGVALIESFENNSVNNSANDSVNNSANDVQASVGCQTISADVCTVVAQMADCLETACSAVGPLLNTRLLAWIDAAGAAGLDFNFSAVAPIVDNDFDLTVDTIGAGAQNATGQSSVVLELAEGQLTSGQGTFHDIGGTPKTRESESTPRFILKSRASLQTDAQN